MYSTKGRTSQLANQLSQASLTGCSKAGAQKASISDYAISVLPLGLLPSMMLRATYFQGEGGKGRERPNRLFSELKSEAASATAGQGIVEVSLPSEQPIRHHRFALSSSVSKQEANMQ